MKEIPVVFKAKKEQIIGVLHIPKNRNPPVVIFLHGWAMGKVGNPQFTFVKAARDLCAAGFAVLRFDFRGVGDSQGDFEKYNTSSMIEDTLASLDFIQKEKGLDRNRIGLLGWSMGGIIAILTASKDKRVKCLVTWASPAESKNLWPPSLLEELKKKGYVIIDYYSQMYATSSSVKDDFKYSALKSMRRVKVPILIIHGNRDHTVPSTEAEKLYRAASKPKKLIMIKSAGHAFSEDKEKLIRESKRWLTKWLKNVNKGSNFK